MWETRVSLSEQEHIVKDAVDGGDAGRRGQSKPSVGIADLDGVDVSARYPFCRPRNCFLETACDVQHTESCWVSGHLPANVHLSTFIYIGLLLVDPH